MKMIYKKRDSRFELIRIMCMFGIVVGHYMCHGGVLTQGSPLNKFIASGVAIWGGKTCNDIFIMISAWFFVDKKCGDLIDKSLLKLIIKTTIFSVFGCGVYCLINGIIDLEALMSSVLWIYTNYGFIAVYTILVLIHPLLNELANVVHEKMLQRICFIGIVLILIFKGAYNVYFTFIVIYLLILYIKRYRINYIKKEWCIYSFVICSVIIKLLQIICQLYLPSKLTFMLDEESDIFVLCNALSAFVFVAKSDIFYNNLVNFIAKGMVAVYLIHENIWLRFHVWSFFKCESFYNSKYMIIHSLFCSCLIMILGVAAGYIYDNIEYIIEKRLLRKE